MLNKFVIMFCMFAPLNLSAMKRHEHPTRNAYSSIKKARTSSNGLTNLKSYCTTMKWTQDNFYNNESCWLFAAIVKEDDSMIRWLLDTSNLNVNKVLMPTKKGYTALFFAARYGRVKAMKAMLSLPVTSRLLQCDKTGRNALHYAAMYGQTEIINELLSSHPNYVEHFLTPDFLGRNSLHFAMLHKELEAGKYLLKSQYAEKFIINNNNEYSPLMYAAHSGFAQGVEWLLSTKYAHEISKPNDNRLTALHFAAKKGHADIIAILLASPSFIEANDPADWHESPLLGAIENNKGAAVNELIGSRYGMSFLRFISKEQTVDDVFKYENMLLQAEKLIESTENELLYRKLMNVARAWHYFAVDLEGYLYDEKFEEILKNINNRICSLLERCDQLTSLTNSIAVTIEEANLFKSYLGVEVGLFNHQVSDTEFREIQREAFRNLQNHRKIISIDVVNEYGEFVKREEQKLNSSSIFHAMTNNEFGDYLIVKFTEPLSIHEIPLFIEYNDQVYRTDVFGGSRIRPNAGANDYGSVFAISLRAADFFKRWFTSEESFWYAQRAFLPNLSNKHGKSIEGSFKIATVTDEEKYCIANDLIVQDGFGYIKASRARELNLLSKQEPNNIYKNIAFQALHSYDGEDNHYAAKDLLSWTIHRLKSAHEDSIDDCSNALMCTMPKFTAIGVPVRDKFALIADDDDWISFAQNGLIVGKNPYNAKSLQVVKNIKGSPYLTSLRVFQYSLTGLYYDESNTVNGIFFKGLLGVVNDEQ